MAATGGLQDCPPRPRNLPQHSPSHTVRCWQGEKSTSRASSEHTRHSAASGPDAAATCRLVTVLGVVRVILGPGATGPPPVCRSLQWDNEREIAKIAKARHRLGWGGPENHSPAELT